MFDKNAFFNENISNIINLAIEEGEATWFCDGNIGDFNTTEPDRYSINLYIQILKSKNV